MLLLSQIKSMWGVISKTDLETMGGNSVENSLNTPSLEKNCIHIDIQAANKDVFLFGH